MPAKYTEEQRIAAFWAKVNKESGHWCNGIQCWFWIAGHLTKGYGYFSNGKRQIGAHVFAYELEIGPVPKDMFVLHRCDNPQCVNPAHLFAGSAKQNMRDMMEKGRDDFPFSTRPELIPRGDDHYTRRHPERVRRGEQLTHTKLTTQQVEEIRARDEAGEKGYMLATEYGVSKAQISRIINYHNRQHG